MINKTIRNLQLIELNILNEVIEVCDKYNIKYFLDSGTALGALRHKGFIPWDDDIDIGMTRVNYDKFIKITQEALSNELFLQIRKTDIKSPYYFARVRKNNTTYMEWDKRNLKIHHGIYIDIFPYDNIPNNKKKRERFQIKCELLMKIYKIRSIPDRYKKPEKKLKWWIVALIRRMLHYIMCPLPINFFENILDKTFRKYNNVETKYITCLSYGGPYTFNKEDIFPMKNLTFENKIYSTPNNIDSYLKELYGDYMELPPKEKRVGHEPYKLTF